MAPVARRRPMFVAAAVAEALARPDDLGVGRALASRTPRAPRARPPARATGRRRRSRPTFQPATRRARPRARVRCHPASPWRSARPSPARWTARRTATGRSRSSRSGRGRRRPGRAVPPASARSRCHDPRSSSRRPRSRHAAGPPPASRRRPAPLPGRGRPTRTSSGMRCRVIVRSAVRKARMTVGSVRARPPEGRQDPVRVSRATRWSGRTVAASARAARPAASRDDPCRQPRTEVGAVGDRRPRGRFGEERRGRQERMRDRAVGPVEEDRPHLAEDHLVGGQVAVLEAVGHAAVGQGVAGGHERRDAGAE